MVTIKNRFTGKIIINGRDYKTCFEQVRKKNTSLFGADLYGKDLSEMNLSEIDLSRADLSEAKLFKANLYRANLSDADLSWTDLSWTNLSDANLYRANLYRANLFKVNLSGVNLFKANLSWANLYGADMDFSCWPLWCGGLNVITDRRLRVQKAYHLLNDLLSTRDLSEDEKKLIEILRPYANEMHRTDVPRL